MAKKDVELFFEEVSKNEPLRAEWEKAQKGITNIKEDELESFFNEKLYPIAKKYGFDFSYNDIRKFKRNLTSDNAEELSDDFLDQVAGGVALGKSYCWKLGLGMSIDTDKNVGCIVFGTN